MPDADFAAALLPHLDAAFTLARWLLRDRAAAEDAVQEGVLRALTYAASHRGDNPRAWLLRIVRNAAHDRLARDRGRREQPLEDAEALHDPAPDPEAALAGREGADRLTAALAALPAELRECIVLRELEDLSYRDIARITDVPVGTVMSRLFRARQALLRLGRTADAVKERLP
jgi:RNA polymerase sigma-70 factor (ECF subfamily)